MTEARNNFRRLGKEECAAALEAVSSPAVMIHVRPDGDAVGSGAALCEIYRQLGKQAKLISQDKIPSRLLFITDKCKTEIAEDSSDIVSAVSIDVASPAQLGSLYSEEKPPVLMLDHHAVGEMFCDGYIIPDASSAAEVLFEVADLLIEQGKISLTENLAYALYSAISSDTGGFKFSNTSAKTHLRAARLVECGIDFADINHRLFSAKSLSQIKAESLIGSRIQTADGGKICYCSITLSDMSKDSLTSEDFESAIDIVRSLSGCEVAVVAKETENGKYKISMRSTGKDVARVAQKFGGGGHIRAAGCTITASSAEEALEKIISEVY